MRLVLPLVAFQLVGVWSVALGQGLSPESLESPGGKAAVSQAVQERLQSISELMAVAKRDVGTSRTRAVARELAIAGLGDLRAVEATSLLIASIEVKSTSLFARDRDESYPCVAALVKIGKPASIAALKELRTEAQSTRRALLVEVLRGVEGEGLSVLMIELDIARAGTNGQTIANLEKAVDYFDLDEAGMIRLEQRRAKRGVSN